MRIPLVRIESLGDSDEPDSVVLQDLNVVETIHQTPNRSSFQTREAIEFPSLASPMRRFNPGRLVLEPLMTSS
ncbi:MAG: hypothetical protein U0Q18_07385 [Bryobacteraceae bacterium]